MNHVSASVLLLQHKELFCLHVFSLAGPLRRVKGLARKWEISLSVFPKDTAMRYHIMNRTMVCNLSITSPVFSQQSYAAAIRITFKL